MQARKQTALRNQEELAAFIKLQKDTEEKSRDPNTVARNMFCQPQ